MRVTWIVSLLCGVAGLLLAVLLGQIMGVMIVAILMAYMCMPLIDAGVRCGLSRSQGALLITFLFFIVLYYVFGRLIPHMLSDLFVLVEQLPKRANEMQELLQQWAPLLMVKLKGSDVLNDWRQWKDAIMSFRTFTWLGGHLTMAAGGLWQLLVLLIKLFFVPWVFVFILMRGELYYGSFLKLYPPATRPYVARVCEQLHDVLLSYFKGQGGVIVSLMIYYVLALNLVGLPFATLLGLLTGLGAFIPFIGWLICLILAFFVYLSSGDVSWFGVAALGAIYLGGNLCESLILTPRWLGHYCKLHTVVVWLGIFVGGQFLGLWGVLLVIPVMLIVRECLRLVLTWYKASQYYA